jgi:peptidoglycan hydrolase-like amidase
MIKLLRLLSLALALGPSGWGQGTDSFGVLGLFHPRELVLERVDAQVVVAKGAGAAVVLNGEPEHRRLLLRADGDAVAGEAQEAAQWTAGARDGGAVEFALSVPGKLRRVYRGQLTVTARGGELTAVVRIDRETAVASIVAAEMAADIPLEALKAQAVAARSFLAGGGRHGAYEFCDTTHCQFLRSPPANESAAMRAAEATRGLILTYQGKTLAAMYGSRCGGRTHSLSELGMDGWGGYPYFAVTCAACRQHPLRWQSRIESGPEPKAGNERARLATARQWGWSALPGNDFQASLDGDGWKIEGQGIGHGVGLCQFGAAGMARSGAGFRAILAHYYPNTSVTKAE